MRFFFCGIVSLFLVFVSPTYAILLSHPSSPVPECNQSYENAHEPKVLSQIFSELYDICVRKGGIRVNTQYIRSGNSSEPYDVILNCIGEKPSDYVLFTCTYGTFKD
ncbi:hypothetical protein [Legionella worsleiensis]|uniref:Uncharacterized protein n=1 Tax=Legionella worsleiensis TaxID=45076 RepID=A0A0W1AL68_9GAMM|nr:hypothetical protein [Legionella worsleiensis]KTD82095.1 hypothetical protein Lwor_0015 [Legionella worsleiensis]STY31476.1 Uncharacterised protein [Legionella worsleiensis]